MKDKNTVRLSIDVDRELKKEFLRVAKENETDGSKLIRIFMKTFVAKNKKENKGHE